MPIASTAVRRDVMDLENAPLPVLRSGCRFR